MGIFSAHLVVTPHNDGLHWELVQDFAYQTDAGETILSPQGRVTDFASVPKLLWNILPPIGPYVRAAVIHDELYYRHRVLSDDSRTRDQADSILYEAMFACAVGDEVRKVIYAGVRVGGGFAWNKKEASNESPDVSIGGPDTR
jgi:hypothetical protein